MTAKINGSEVGENDGTVRRAEQPSAKL